MLSRRAGWALNSLHSSIAIESASKPDPRLPQVAGERTVNMRAVIRRRARSSLARREGRLEDYLLALDQRGHVEGYRVARRRISDVESNRRASASIRPDCAVARRLPLVEGAVVCRQENVGIWHRLPLAGELEGDGQFCLTGRLRVREQDLGAGEALLGHVTRKRAGRRLGLGRGGC